jgi:hypothetical protein
MLILRLAIKKQKQIMPIEMYYLVMWLRELSQIQMK